jgi:uncharacterized protein YqcC (DUF446 family)
VPDLDAFDRLADLIEAELRSLRAWQADPLPRETIEGGGAFGMNTMAFSQWVQFVLVPRLHEVAAGAIEMPPESHVGVQAVREFDSWPEAIELTRLLIEVDGLVGRWN